MKVTVRRPKYLPITLWVTQLATLAIYSSMYHMFIFEFGRSHHSRLYILVLYVRTRYQVLYTLILYHTWCICNYCCTHTISYHTYTNIFSSVLLHNFVYIVRFLWNCSITSVILVHEQQSKVQTLTRYTISSSIFESCVSQFLKFFFYVKNTHKHLAGGRGGRGGCMAVWFCHLLLIV